jgi:TolA-binding protein
VKEAGMNTGWLRRLSAIFLVAAVAGCGARVESKAPVTAARAPEKARAGATIEDRLSGYPDAPGSKEALAELVAGLDKKSAEERLAVVLRYAKEPAGAKLFQAELERRKGTASEEQALIERVRAEAPGSPAAAAALSAELDALRAQDPAQFLARCEAVVDGSDACEAEKAVALFKRATHYGESGNAKPAALDALRFWAEHPDKVRRMKAGGRLAGLVRDAGYLCEAEMLLGTDEPEAVALALNRQFGPLRAALADGKSPEKVEASLAAYVLNAPEADALAATTAEAAPSPEKAQCLGRLQRLAAYAGDLDRVVDFSQQYTDVLRSCVDGNSIGDDSLAFAFVQTSTLAECLRRLLADPHFVRSMNAEAAGAAASMRSEQVLAGLSGLSLDLAERRWGKGQIDETKVAEAYTRHVETLQTINDSDNTIKAYRRFLEGHPKAGDAPGMLNRVAETYRSLGALGNAAEAFKELAERYPDAPETPAARFNRVVCLYQSESYEAAYEEGTAVCAAKPDEPNTANILLICGLSQAAMGVEDDAGKTMNDILARYSKSSAAPQAMLWLASRALLAQQYREAKRLFQDLVERYPDSEASQRAHEYMDRLAKMPTEAQDAK